MPLSREDLERQLTQAKERRDSVAAGLQKEGVSEKDLRRQPAWRNAHATCRQLTRRLRTVSAKEELVSQKGARGEAQADE